MKIQKILNGMVAIIAENQSDFNFFLNVILICDAVPVYIVFELCHISLGIC
jgi:hypothetical protein